MDSIFNLRQLKKQIGFVNGFTQLLEHEMIPEMTDPAQVRHDEEGAEEIKVKYILCLILSYIMVTA